MKKTFLKVALAAGLLSPICALAQHAPSAGYWVVESNLKAKKNSIVRFYNDQHQLVYEEKVTGRNLDVRRPKNKRLLDHALQQVMTAPPTLAILQNKKPPKAGTTLPN